MDDPWGSPWASAPSDAVSKNDPSPSRPTTLLSPPPKAFFGSNTASPALSPWTDHHGLDEWTNTGQTDDTLAATPAWGPWAEPGQAPRAESPGKQSPIAWPGSAATSPGLMPTLRSRSASDFRQPSPDPWAIESPWTDRNQAASLDPSRQVQVRSESGADTSAAVVIDLQEPNKSLEHSGNGAGETLAFISNEEVETVGALGIAPRSVDNLSIEAEARESPSRPSSTFSTESTHNLDRQDSPITSIDEDSNFRPQYATKKTSRKVSELVGHYDGLTRAASEEPPTTERHGPQVPSRESGDRSSRSVEQEDKADSGAWENATAVAGEVLDDAARTSISSDRSPTPKVKTKDRDFKHDNSTENDDKPYLEPKGHSAPIQQLLDKFGVIQFEPDLTLLDKTFAEEPECDLDVSSARSVVSVSDRVITDSFNTVDERKTWYRISRFGTMRKHNSGDEENYHRVDWQSSQLHADTIKIVRRWMEEDSFSGKPILGGSKRTSVFNWDSSAAPVSLDKVFARRSLVAHPKASGIAPLGHSPSSSVGSLSSVFEDRKTPRESISSFGLNTTAPASASASPVPSFGWSSNPLPFVQTIGTRANTTNSGTTLHKITAINSPVVPQPMSDVRANQTQSVINRHDEIKDGDEDDDWGDMVFSPTQETFTTLDGSGSLQDIEPQNLTSVPATQKLQMTAEPPTLPTTMHPPSPDFKAPTSPGHAMSHASPSALTNALVSINAGPQAPMKLSGLDASTVPADPVVGSGPVMAMSPSESLALASYSSNIIPDGSKTNVEVFAANVSLCPIQSSEENTGNEIVERILQNLPDLTYMSR